MISEGILIAHYRIIEPLGMGGMGAVYKAHDEKLQRVVALNSAPCQMCFYCSKHQENLCEDLLFNNGAYAEYIRVPRRIVDSAARPAWS